MRSADPAFAPTVDSDIIRKPEAASPQRLLSIDILRGLTIAVMIIVNDQSGPAPFSQLQHAAWNGFTLTDLVFPTFLLLVGLSTVLSIAARTSRGASKSTLLVHVFRRSLLLIAFGFVVNNFPFFHLSTARYYGVLPRIGLCYLVVASLFIISRGWKDKLALACVCLIVYWLLMRFVPVPGFGMPGHDVAINDHDGNLTAWLDRQIFSAPHLYERTRDPEGILSTLPAIATALIGVLTGLWLKAASSATRKAQALFGAGLCLLAVGLAWNIIFPINKKLWTSSFVLFAAGWGLLLLAAAIYLVDIKRFGRDSKDGSGPEGKHSFFYMPFLVLGTNAVLAYMLSELGDALLRALHTSSGASYRRAAFSAVAHLIPSPAWSSLVYSLLNLLVCWLVVLPFYRKRIFLRI